VHASESEAGNTYHVTAFIAEEVFRQNDPARLALFARRFYDDTDPRLAHLARVAAPTLVIDAEHDDAMRAPSKLIRENVPECDFISLPGVGHMTALECPDALAEIIERFASA
jgi:pimeloyl-ACP methyl ester carboxylesterase